MKAQASAAKAGLRKRLGEILIKKGFLTPEQFQEVLKSQTVKSKRIGSYELISKLGEGGMGAVFKARQVFLDRIIALKILSPKMAKNKDARDRFVREARAVAKLNHPNIVAGIDVGSSDGYCYFAMEFVDGESLGEYLHRKGGKLPENTTLEFIRQAALALHHAHQNNLLHRDVKPDNLLLDRERNIVKLADLGLARSAESAEDDKQLTKAGQAVGTPFYISPEQARGLSDLLPATDLYSLGASMFHFLTGQVPFDGTTAAVIMTRHLTDPVPDLRKINPNISEAAAKIVLRCMEKKPENRYHSATELIADIEKVQRGEPISMEVSNKSKGHVRALDRASNSERETSRDQGRDQGRTADKHKILTFRDEKDKGKNDSSNVRAKHTTKAPVATHPHTTAVRSVVKKRRTNNSTNVLVFILFFVSIATAVIVLKPIFFKDKPAKSSRSPAPNDTPISTPSPIFLGLPATVMRAADGTLSFSVNFDGDVSACESDDVLKKTGENLELVPDANKNNTVKLVKFNPKDVIADSMLRLVLPADLILTSKATLKFKICVSKAPEAEPLVYIHWLHQLEGADSRSLATFTNKLKGKNCWVDVSIPLNAALNSAKADTKFSAPQSITFYAARPDAETSVFIDSIEITDEALGRASSPSSPIETEKPIVPLSPAK
jgi:serine/threonine-protein kinase